MTINTPKITHKTRIKPRTAKKMAFIVLTLSFLLVLSINSVSAWEFDNVYNYDKQTKTVDVRNSVLGFEWWQLDQVAEIKLLSEPSIRGVINENDKEMIFEIELDLKEDYTNPLKSVDVYRIDQGMNQISKTFEYRQRVKIGEEDKYEFVCSETGKVNSTGKMGVLCQDEVVGKKDVYEYQPIDVSHLTAGKYVLGGFTEVRAGEHIEWIPKWMGVEITEWADFVGYTLYERQTTSFATASNMYDPRRFGQVFKVGASGTNEDFTLKGVSFKAYNHKAGLNMSCVVADAISDYEPDMTANLSVNITVQNYSINASSDINITMPDTTLSADGLYAVYCWGELTGDFEPKRSDGTNPYPAGQRVQSTSSPCCSWNNASDTTDVYFKIWGEAIDYAPYISLNDTPADGANFTGKSHTLGANSTDDRGVLNVSIYINGAYNATAFNTSSRQKSLNISQTLTFSDATFNWSGYACDSNNNCTMTANKTFTVQNFIENAILYNSSVPQGTTTDFVLNMTADGLETITATFNYNNTEYSSSKYGDDEEMRFERTLTVNDVATNQFYWVIDYGGTLSNTTMNNQTVEAMNLTDCSVSGVPIFNFTVYDEKTKDVLNGAMENVTIEIDLIVTSLAGVEILNYSANTSDTNPVRVCTDTELVSGGIPLIIDGMVRYEAEGQYISEFYTIQNFSLTNSSLYTNTSLYDLKSADAQEFKITYKDENFLPVTDAVLDLQRYYVGDGIYRTVEMPPFDDNGATLANLVLGDVIYTMIIKKDNVILATFDNIKAFCDNVATGECEINLNSFSSQIPTQDYSTTGGVTFTMDYTRATRVVRAIFSTTDANSAVMLLNVTLTDMFGNHSLCSDTLTASSGTLTCTIPASYGNASATGTLYKDSSFIGRIRISLWEDSDSIWGANQITVSILAMLTLIGVGVASGGVMIIIFLAIGLILNLTLVLTQGSGYFGAASTFLWIIIALIILLFKMNRRKNL